MPAPSPSSSAAVPWAVDGPTDCGDPAADEGGRAAALNAGCRCVSLDRDVLCAEIGRMVADPEICASLQRTHGNLFAGVSVFVDEQQMRAMQAVIQAVEAVVANPGYRQAVLARAPTAARHETAALGASLGYDFHLEGGGVQLIEINTNAGGALLNALLRRAQRACCAEVAGLIAAEPADNDIPFLAMFLEEWRRQMGDRPLRRIAIVDDGPEDQFLYPEFLMFRALFRRHGVAAEVADVRQLVHGPDGLWLEDAPVDLVYNRHTDFSLERPESAALRAAWLSGDAVVTPHPRAHALYADKRNLVLLSDDALLAAWGVDATSRASLRAGVPRTLEVEAVNAEALWSQRREWFFKPAAGFGSRAAYRGDKITRRVFGEIVAGGYVAQRTVMPSRRVTSDAELKVDLRCYVYAGQVQLVAARLYEGQTTNFRTAGGGFAPVVVISRPAGADGSAEYP